MKLCHDGVWKAVCIDDLFPCYPPKYGSGPCFTTSLGKEIWVLILEKSFSKIFGSYEKIESGIPEEALKTLTGAPVITY